MATSRVTLREIAARVGVAASTVSRALHDDPRISERTKARILRAFAELQASAAESPELDSVGILRVNMENGGFFAHVLEGVMEHARHSGTYVLVEVLSRLDRMLPYSLVHRRVAGWLVIGRPIDPNVIRRLLQLSVPTVFIGRYGDHMKLNTVISDNVAGGRLAAEHLISCGYETLIPVIHGTPFEHFQERLAGFRSAAGERVRSAFTFSPDRRILDKLLMEIESSLRLGRRVGLFAVGDTLAVRILEFLRAKGARIPEDVGICGYDGLRDMLPAPPLLTSIDVPKKALGYLAVRLLGDIVAGVVDPPVQVHVQPRLLPGDTTARISGSD